MASQPPLDHPLLTTMGLFVEAHAGLARAVEQQLERDSGLSHQWFEVLIRLARSPGERLRMSELAAQTTLTPSGLTRAVDRLEGAGLVERQACPTDRRSAYAALTPAGRQRIHAAVPLHLTHLQVLLDDVLDPGELAELDRLVRKLRDSLHPCAAAVAAEVDARATPG